MSFLSDVGSVVRKVLHIGVEVATVVEPDIDALFPSIAGIYSSALGLAIAEEATAATATGSGTVKLAQVVAKVTPLFEQAAAKNGLVLDATKINDWASLVVDTLNGKFPLSLPAQVK